MEEFRAAEAEKHGSEQVAHSQDGGDHPRASPPVRDQQRHKTPHRAAGYANHQKQAIAESCSPAAKRHRAS